MNPQAVFCPNIDCPARGRTGQGNIGVHDTKDERYMCRECKRPFSATKGTIFYRLHTDPVTVLLVITLLAYGCPTQAIVMAYGFDERTVKKWWRRSGEHCRVVHEHMIEQRQFDLGQVQADEIKAKMQGASVWLAMAIMVSTRLWLGGVVGASRNQDLIAALVAKVRRMALCRPLLLAVDGLASYVSAFQSAFRSPLPRPPRCEEEDPCRCRRTARGYPPCGLPAGGGGSPGRGRLPRRRSQSDTAAAEEEYVPCNPCRPRCPGDSSPARRAVP